MKKYLSSAAFVLLTATMSLSFSFVSCSDNDEPKSSDVPANATQAKQMLVGQWQTPLEHFEDGYDFHYASEKITELTADGKVFRIYKVREDSEFTRAKSPTARYKPWWADYMGKYVGYQAGYWDTIISEDDPSSGIIALFEEKPGSTMTIIPEISTLFTSLTKNSFFAEGATYHRMKQPVKYTIIDEPEYDY